MMRTIGARQGLLLPAFALSATAVLIAEWIAVHSDAFLRNPDVIAIAVTFDIVVVLPALFYFLILRPRKASPILVIPSFLLSMIVAARLLPVSYHSYLASLRNLLPLLELGLLVYVISRIPAFRRLYGEERKKSIYFTDAFISALSKTVGNRTLVAILAAEFFLVVFAFAGWFLRWKDASKQVFTYHRKSGYSAIVGVMLFVTLVETAGLHVIVSRWSIVWAWVLTALSIYGILWILGDFHALRLHPIVLENDVLHLRTGLRWRADLPLHVIADVTVGPPQNRKSKSYLRASVLWPRAVIHLNEPVRVNGLFGISKVATEIGVSVDEPERFREAVVSGKERS